jgi:hypothetical protein
MLLDKRRCLEELLTSFTSEFAFVFLFNVLFNSSGQLPAGSSVCFPYRCPFARTRRSFCHRSLADRHHFDLSTAQLLDQANRASARLSANVIE